MKIDSNWLISDLQEAFTKRYPYLRFELYRDDNTKNGSRFGKLIGSQKIQSVMKGSMKVNMEINDELCISDLKEMFKKIGLLIQVFRRSGSVWVETTLTDAWSLQRQNEEGEIISSKQIDKN